MKNRILIKLFLFQLTINEKSQNLRRLQAQRNELNAKGEKKILKNFKINIKKG